MRGFILLLFLSICAITGFAQTQVAKKTSYGRGYLEYVPAGYSSSSELYPCIIFLHGSGERGDGSPAALEKVKAHGIPKFIKNGANMCFTVNGKQECFIVLSPQQITGRSGWTKDVVPFAQYALANYRIDPNRVYVTGLSMGGDGTWDASYTTGNDPNYFAAVAPVSCKGDYNGGKVTATRKIPVWAFHGDNDTAVPVSDGRRPINGMNSVNPNPAPIFTLVAGGTHGGSTWDKVYSPTHTYYSTNLYEWFLSQKRSSSGAPPVANAGQDKTIILPTNTTILNGSGSDSDGQIVSYSWSQVSGPNTATTSPLNLSNLTISNCVEGTYTFTLTVTDNDNKTAVDNVSTTVARINQPPVVDAGTDKLITLPTNTTLLTGSGNDSDGQVVSYSWKQKSGPTTATTSNLNQSDLTVSNCSQGKYTFTLTVTDNENTTSVDSTSIIVQSNINQPPIVSAGSDKMLTFPNTSVMLNSLASDVDGTIVSYQWVKTWGPAVTLTNANTPAVSVVGSAPGTYTFKLTVTDDKGLTAFDKVNVTIKEAPSQTTTLASTTMLSTTLEGEVALQETSFISTSLNQNYPNPFSNQTTIPFTLQTSQHVVVKVYDFYGTEIQTLIDEVLEVGEHSVAFSPSSPNQFFFIKLFADGKLFSVKATQLQ